MWSFLDTIFLEIFSFGFGLECKKTNFFTLIKIKNNLNLQQQLER